ncbi:MAG TPA: hypothetical protein VNU48_10800, partial [Burkholderiaceae bacterium]|nr:hypothetical protein [Burkholderiaceae bacterium]
HRLHCAARSGVAPQNSLRSLRSLRSNSRGESVYEARAARAPTRWWSLWGAVDLVPLDDKVLVANPALVNPLQDATELAVDGPAQGRVVLAGGFGSHGEAVRMERDARGRPTAFWLAGTRLRPEAAIAKELMAKYERPRHARAAARGTRRIHRNRPRLASNRRHQFPVGLARHLWMRWGDAGLGRPAE